MNTGVEVALLVPVAYLLGTFPSATLVARRRGVDVTAEGSGNPGASNTFRLLGWKAGALVFAMDVLKGVLAALAGLAVDGHRGAYVLGVAAVIGVTDIAGLLQEITENEGAQLGIFFMVAMVFVVLTLPLGVFGTSLSRRLAVKR